MTKIQTSQVDELENRYEEFVKFVKDNNIKIMKNEDNRDGK